MTHCWQEIGGFNFTINRLPCVVQTPLGKRRFHCRIERWWREEIRRRHSFWNTRERTPPSSKNRCRAIKWAQFWREIDEQTHWRASGGKSNDEIKTEVTKDKTKNVSGRLRKFGDSEMSRRWDWKSRWDETRRDELGEESGSKSHQSNEGASVFPLQ